MVTSINCKFLLPLCIIYIHIRSPGIEIRDLSFGIDCIPAVADPVRDQTKIDGSKYFSGKAMIKNLVWFAYLSQTLDESHLRDRDCPSNEPGQRSG